MMRFVFGMSALALIAAAGVHPARADGFGPGTRYYAQGVYNWTGFYVGGNVGYGWSQGCCDNSFNGVPVSADSVKVDGVIGGGQVGYNLQTGNWVFGIETDFQGSGQTGKDQFIGCPATIGVCGGINSTDNHSLQQDWFGTTRGRLGYAWGDWLLYGTGGVAYERWNDIAILSCPVCTTTTTLTASGERVGWVAGGGVEAALRGNWTWKIEYLHLEYGTFTTIQQYAGNTAGSLAQPTDDIVRVGINYRFGGGFSGGSLK